MTYSARQLLEVREMIQSGAFTFLKTFVNDRKEAADVNADHLSSNLTSLLEREQEIGAAKTLKSLIGDFSNHIDSIIKEAQEKEAQDHATSS